VGQKRENKPSEPKNEIRGPKSVWSFPSFENFTRSKKKYTFGGQKGENKPSPKTEFGPQKIKNKCPLKQAGLSKIYSKKNLSDPKERKQASKRASWSILKEKTILSSSFLLLS
jgi:hypothetical protein